MFIIRLIFLYLTLINTYIALLRNISIWHRSVFNEELLKQINSSAKFLSNYKFSNPQRRCVRIVNLCMNDNLEIYSFKISGRFIYRWFLSNLYASFVLFLIRDVRRIICQSFLTCIKNFMFLLSCFLCSFLIILTFDEWKNDPKERVNLDKFRRSGDFSLLKHNNV